MEQQTVEHEQYDLSPLKPEVLARKFKHYFGQENPRFFYAPGRVNLIGEHTDYNEGFVLPIAINMGTLVAGLSRSDRLIQVHSCMEQETITVSMDDQKPHSPGHWIHYIYGMARSLEDKGYHLRGADLIIDSNIPMGSGLSSSAALENAVAVALLSLSGEPVTDRVQIALAGQEAEHQYVGTQCGVMDQLVTALAEKDHALLIDCRSLKTQSIPMNLQNLTIVICDSKVKHQLASSAYNLRVAECRRGLEALQSQGLTHIHSLRDLDETMLAQYQNLITDDIVLKRVKHVVTENTRTLKAAQALKNGDVALLGQLMFASHQSLKNDYEVSCPELDTLVDIARNLPGVMGARMTGGGFGGCTVNLVQDAKLSGFIEAITERYDQAFGLKPNIYTTLASEGMREVIMPAELSQAELNQQLNEVFHQAFDNKQLSLLTDFANLHMPSVTEVSDEKAITAKLWEAESHSLPALAEIQWHYLRLTVSREFEIRIYDRGHQLTTDLVNIPQDYPWFMSDPEDPEDIAGYATRHVARGSRGESPWPESQWPLIGGVRQGEQNWPHRAEAFGPYQLALMGDDEGQPAILLSGLNTDEGPPYNAYGVTPRGLFMMTAPNSILMALQHENHSPQGLSWAPWLVLGFAVPREGTLTNPSTILAFPDQDASDPVQERLTKVWNYTEIEGMKIALINPHAKTLNEPFKKLYRDVNWSVLAFKGADYIILTRSVLRHEEQFFPFLEHGRYFVEVEHTGPRVPPGEKSTVLIQHDIVSVAALTQGHLLHLSTKNHVFEQDVRQILAVLVHKAKNGELLYNYKS